MSGLRSYSHVCLPILSIVPFTPQVRVIATGKGLSRTWIAQAATSHHPMPHREREREQGSDTCFRHRWAPQYSLFWDSSSTPSPPRGIVARASRRGSHSCGQTRQEFRVTHHMCERVRGVVTPCDLGNDNGVCFNSSLCPKLFRGQVRSARW